MTSDTPTPPASDAFKLTQQELLLREKEVIGLREKALQQLESQLESKGKELATLIDHMEVLKRDFKYNLGLLEERDAELEQFENEHSLLSAIVTEKEMQLAQVQKKLNEAQTALRMEQAKRGESEVMHQTIRSEIQQKLEEERAAHAKSMLRQREEGEAVTRALQRALYESEEASQRQRREMTADSTLRIQEALAASKSASAAAVEEAESCRLLAQQREQEVSVVRQREAEQVALREDALTRLRESEKMARSLSMEAEHMRARASSSEEEIRDLKRAGKAAEERHEATVDQISRQLATAQGQLEMLLSETSDALAKIQVKAKEDEAFLKVKLEQSQARCNAAEEQSHELQNSLRTLKREMQAKVSDFEQELRLVKETSEMALSDYERKREREMRDLKDQIQTGDDELHMMRENMVELSRALEERKRETDAARESLREASEREAKLQMEINAFQHNRPNLGNNSDLISRLTEQRDAAKCALEEAQSRLLDKESEIGQLRDVLAQLSPRRIGGVSSVIAAVRGRGGKSSSSQVEPRERFRSLSVQLPGGSSGHTGSSSPSAAPPPPHLALESSMDSLPDLASLQQAFLALAPSPTSSAVAAPRPPQTSGSLPTSRATSDPLVHQHPYRDPDEPLSSSSSPNVFEPKSLQHHFSSDGVQNGGDPSQPLVDRVGPRGDLGELLRPFAESLLHQFQAQALNHQELDQVRETARQLGEENVRLKGTLAMMRNEMEALLQQQQQAGPMISASGPEDRDEPNQQNSMSLLRSELQESDKDVLQAMAHVSVLQRQLSMTRHKTEESSGGLNHDEHLPAAGETELSFLRGRSHDLTIESRSLRRQLLQSRLPPLPASTSSKARDSLDEDPVVPLFHPLHTSTSSISRIGSFDQEEDLVEGRQAKEDLSRVISENNRLMELSNSLRAERDRLLSLVSALTARELSGEEIEMDNEFDEATVEAASYLVAKPQSRSGQSSPVTVLDPSPFSLQHSPHPQRRLIQDPALSQPSADIPFTFPNQQASIHSPPPHILTHPFLAIHPAASKPSTVSQDSYPRDPMAALTAVAISKAQHQRRQASNASSEVDEASSNPNPDPAFHIGSVSPSSRPPSAVPGSASSRETASQRSRLLSLQRRKEAEARQAELEEMKPQIRNYNIKDDGV